MTRRRVTAFVDALLANRRPASFPASAEDAEAMRAAIELRNGQPGASMPRPEFVSELHHRLREDMAAPEPARPSRRGVLTAAAAVAAAAVAGAVSEREIASSPRATPSASELLPDRSTWRPVATSADLAAGASVRFSTDSMVGFVSRKAGRLEAVSGVCTHQGCLLALDATGSKLDCPCHRAAFGLSGEVLNHQFPAPLPPLPRLAVRERDGQIEVALPTIT